MLYDRAAVPCCMSFCMSRLYICVTCSCSMCMLHARGCIPFLHVLAALPYCMVRLQFLAACPSCTSMLHSHAACERCMSAQHVQCCRFYMSMLHAHAASPCGRSMQHKFEAKRGKRGKKISSLISLRRY
jgi:hypothetical protein